MEDFVSFELAQKLKEKGLNVSFYFYYRTDDKSLRHANVTNPLIYCDKIDDEVVIAPTISQILKWLRKEKKISIEVGIHCSLKWMCTIYGFSDELVDFTQYTHNGIDDTVFILYETYEQAALAGIEYTINNLI